MLLHVLKVRHHISHGCDWLTPWSSRTPHKSMLANVGMHALLWSPTHYSIINLSSILCEKIKYQMVLLNTYSCLSHRNLTLARVYYDWDHSN